MIRTYRDISKTWYVLLNSVKLILGYRQSLNKNSQDNHETYSLNATLILNSAAVIEGAVSSLLLTHIQHGENYKKANKNTDLELRRILDNLIQQIHRLQWKDINDMSMLVVDIDMKLLYKENWEAIMMLFDFRNLLAHGGTIINSIDLISEEILIEEIRNEVRVENITKAKLLEYLQKMGLMNKRENGVPLGFEFLNTKITDHFVEAARKFIQMYYNTYVAKHHGTPHVQRDIQFINDFIEKTSTMP